MDILAARKKAAERAKAAQAAEQKGQGETAPSLPPVPDTTFVPGEQVSDAMLMPDVAGMPAEPEEREVTTASAADGTGPEPAPAPPPAAAIRTHRHDEMPAQSSGTAQPEQPQQEQEMEMLAFLLGSEEYVVPVDQVHEVLTPKEITPVPHVPEHILGVCSLRGMVLPIVDLRRRLGLGAAQQDDKSRIVVVSLGQDDMVGLAVDRVRGVVRFAPSAVRPAPETVEQGAELLKGIARKDERLLILLDVEKAVGLTAQKK